MCGWCWGKHIAQAASPACAHSLAASPARHLCPPRAKSPTSLRGAQPVCPAQAAPAVAASKLRSLAAAGCQGWAEAAPSRSCCPCYQLPGRLESHASRRALAQTRCEIPRASLLERWTLPPVAPCCAGSRARLAYQAVEVNLEETSDPLKVQVTLVEPPLKVSESAWSKCVTGSFDVDVCKVALDRANDETFGRIVTSREITRKGTTLSGTTGVWVRAADCYSLALVPRQCRHPEMISNPT